MASTYTEIVKQIQHLQKQADAARTKEVEGVISRIKEAIVFYKLTGRDLGLDASTKQPSITPKNAPIQKFSDGNGNTWGGRGPRPAWLKAALDSGKAVDDFKISAEDGAAAGAVPKNKKRVAAKRRKIAAKYQDDKGNTWAGRGLQPRWFKEALETGKTPESMLI